MRSVSLIAAVSDNNVIGYQGKLPWHIPEDLHWFRTQTLYKTVIMGYDTYQSLPKPLTYRHEVIVTSRHVEPKEPGHRINITASIIDAIKTSELPVVLMGGQTIYEEGIQYVNSKMYITFVDGEYPGDRWLYLPHYCTKPDKQKYLTSSSGIRYHHSIFDRRNDLK